MIRYLYSCLLVLILTLSARICHAETALPMVSEAVLTNMFRVQLTQTDSVTVYLQNHGVFAVIPSTNNKRFRHGCDGTWKFSKKKQHVVLSHEPMCDYLAGTWLAALVPEGIQLKTQNRRILLAHFETSPPRNR
jgi:hypothetical protein